MNPALLIGLMFGGIADGRPLDIADPRIPQAPESADAARRAAAEKRARKAARRAKGAADV